MKKKTGLEAQSFDEYLVKWLYLIFYATDVSCVILVGGSC